MIEEQIDLTTTDGQMTTFVYRPEHDGPHPVVLYLMDAPSIRPALQEMASRLATAGYYVLLPYLYHRVGPFKRWDQDDDAYLHQRGDLMGSVDPTGIVVDAEALLAHAAMDPAAADGPVGVVGLCMSGSLALSVAKAFPDRVRAAASIHGAFFVREDRDDSPHRDLDRIKAELHFAWCADDPTAPEEDRDIVTRSLDEAGVTYTLDVEETARHGFAPAGHRHDHDAAERQWERVHSLFSRRL